MNLPENGRVVVIDDKFNEALPLINVLSKNGIPVTYFSGLDINELPATPLLQTKIIFLDIVLGTEGQPEKTKISTLMSVLTRIIDSNNGPYIIIAWTKHNEHIEQLRIGLEKKKIKPVIILNLEKSTYCKSDSVDKEGNQHYIFIDNALNCIEEKLKEELTNAGALHIFILWENLVHKSAGEIIKDFSSFYPQDSNWDENMCCVFYKLAKAYAGEQLTDENMNELIKNALLTFNNTFLDTLENKIRVFHYSEEIERIEIGGKIDNKIQAKINSKLLLIKAEGNIPVQPGNIYESDMKNRIFIGDLFDDQKEWYKVTAEFFDKIKYISIEVSPSCDYAQDKWKVHRLLSGVMLPVEYYEKIKKAEYILSPPLFEIDGSIYKFVFDLRYLLSSTFEDFKEKCPILRIRHELLVEIQSHIARHINRPGVVSL